MTYHVKDRDVAPRLLLSRLYSGSCEQASGSGEQASGSDGQASGSEESGDPKPTLQDPHRDRRPSRDCRGGFHFSVER